MPFEVLYIGKSYGRIKLSNAVNRLYNQEHKALKKILINISESEPDKEIFMLALNFPYLEKIFRTGYEYFETTLSREMERINRIKATQISPDMRINIIEEALINYFRPQYNKLLKNSAEKLSSKAVQFFQNIDITGLYIELKTLETGAQLFSEYVPAKKIHLIKFPISKDPDRLHVFNEMSLPSSREENIDHLI